MRHCSNFLIYAVASMSIVGCHHGTSESEALRLDEVRSTARSALVGLNRDTIRVDVTVLNTATTPRALRTWVCVENSLVIKIQKDGRIWGSAEWERGRARQAVARNSVGKDIPIVYACSTVAVRQLLPGRSVLAYSNSVPVREVLGDSLPSGHYEIKAFFSLNRRSIEGVPAGEIELHAPPT
jgi:hypothetical protein